MDKIIYSMNLSDYKNQWVFDKINQCYSLLNMVYCQKPLAPELQCMNIFVPKAYLTDYGDVITDGTAGKYTALTAPVVFENGVGGYSESAPGVVDSKKGQGLNLLRLGMIYVNCGCRGKQTQLAGGTFIGKSPMGLVDLKAGIRFLKHNKGIIPGDMNRIISVGVSAGGAMSSLLGSTGNSGNYEKYLLEAGGIMEETDDIFASQCYCPIIDLDHADIAYEWMFQKAESFRGMFGSGGGELTLFQKALSKKLTEKYISYFNELKLVNPVNLEILQLGDDGRSGSGYVFLMKVLEKAATKHLELLKENKLSINCSLEDYIHGNYTFLSDKPQPGHAPIGPIAHGSTTAHDGLIAHNGSMAPGGPLHREPIEVKGLDKSEWLKWYGIKAGILNLDEMEKSYVSRMKDCTSFDDFNKCQAENQEFGSVVEDVLHFDTYIYPVLEELKEQFPEEYEKYEQEFNVVIENKELEMRKYLINPFRYIGTNEICDIAPFYRIRVGTMDAHTSFTMAMTLALKLEATGKTKVDYAMVWDEDHGAADYKGELGNWITSIC